MEGEGDYYTDRYTVSTRMTPALRWAAMRAILMFHNCEGLSHKTVSTDHNFSRERRAEADSNRGPSAYLPNALPLGPNRLSNIGGYYHGPIYTGITELPAYLGSNPLRLSFSLQKLWSVDTVLFVTLSLRIYETLKWLPSLPT